MTDFSIIIHEPSDEYHACSKAGEFMSSHMLADFRESPALYRKEILGQIEESESPAFAIGRIRPGTSMSSRHLLISIYRKNTTKQYFFKKKQIFAI